MALVADRPDFMDTDGDREMRSEMSMAKRKRRKFTQEFKREVIELCKRGDRSFREISRDLDLTETAVRAWVKLYDIDAGEGPPGALTTAEKDELGRSRREVRQLREE